MSGIFEEREMDEKRVMETETEIETKVEISLTLSVSSRYTDLCWNGRIFLGDSMSFHGFLCDSMPTPLVGSRRFLLYNHTGLFVSCFQQILSFYHVYNEPAPLVILELTHFHRLHQQPSRRYD